MRRPPSVQERADALLHEWAGGVEAALGHGYPPAPQSGRVQNGRGDSTSPERYAHSHARHEQLDRAARRVADIDPRWRGVLWVQYVQRVSSMGILADRMGASERTCRRWLKKAREAFIEAFDGSLSA